MDQLADELRRVLTDDRRALPPGPDPVAAVRRGMRRRRRRRLAAASSGALAVAGLLAGVTFVLAPSGAGTAVLGTGPTPSTSSAPSPTPPADGSTTVQSVPWLPIPVTGHVPLGDASDLFFEPPPHGGLPQRPGPPSPPPAPSPNPAWAGLRATIHPPASYHPGDVLRYTVTLVNPTPTTIALSPCPAYGESVGVQAKDSGGGRAEYYGLNCAAAPPRLRPGDSVTFAMRFASQALLAETDRTATLRWQFAGLPVAQAILPLDRSTAARTVAWVDRPAPPYQAQPYPTPPAAPTLRPCTPTDLRAERLDGGAAAGNVKTPFSLTNTSTTGCTIDGYPTLTGLDGGGQRVPIAVHHGTFDSPTTTQLPATIAPGERANMTIGTSDACDALTNSVGPRHTYYDEVALGLPGGGRVGTGARIDAACALGVSRFFVRVPPPTPVPGPYAGLTASADVPATARVDTTLRYKVTLTNPTDAGVRLDPCPTYTQDVGFPRDSTAPRYYSLNCDTVQTIPAHGAVRYAMQLAVPAGLRPGTATFDWTLYDQAPISTGGTITLTR